jgi:hypothetical protein
MDSIAGEKFFHFVKIGGVRIALCAASQSAKKAARHPATATFFP